MIRKILTSSLIALVGIGGFFVNINQGGVSGNGSLIISGTTETYAAFVGPCPEGTFNDGKQCVSDTVKKWNDLIDYLNMALGAITFIVSPAIILASWLMSPDWTSGDLFGLREVMHNLWITISNILYFVYAILLIIIALATMFNQEKFGYKVMLPKLALGIILVPFTWWFVQWTISLAAVVTASVVSIPTDTISKVMDDAGVNENSWYNRPVIPEEIIVSDATTQESFSQSKKCLSDGATEDGGSFCISPKKFFTNYGGMWSPLVVYAYGVFKFDKVEHLNTSLDMIQAAIQLVHKGIIGALMFMVFGILVIALIFMLMLRAIKLWFYAIFSPLFTLHFVVGKDLMGDKSDNFSLKEFVGLAFVPAVVGITLSFGLVIITAIYNPISKTTGVGADGKNELVLFGNPSNKIISEIVTDGEKQISQTTVMIGEVKWIFKGSAVNTGNNSQVYSALDSAGNVLGTIIIDIIALVFIWAAFMAAKGVSKAVDAAVQPFENMGKKIGELGMSLPKYTPIPGLGVSASGMEKLASHQIHKIDKAHEESLANSDMGKRFGYGNGVSEASYRQFQEYDKNVKNLKTDKTEFGKMWNLVMQESGKTNFDTHAMWQDLVTRMKRDGVTEADMQSIGVNSELAKKIYNDAIKGNQGDLKYNKELLEALKKSGTSGGSSTTNLNTFSIKTDVKGGATTYELDSPNLKVSGTKEQILTAIQANIGKVASTDSQILKKELSEIWDINGKEIKDILNKIEQYNSSTKSEKPPNP